MLNANEIRNVRFSTAMGGYKKEEPIMNSLNVLFTR